MSLNEIKVGDKVEVTISSEWFEGEVLYIPCATGDSWRIKDRDGNLRYVQTYEQIVRKAT